MVKGRRNSETEAQRPVVLPTMALSAQEFRPPVKFASQEEKANRFTICLPPQQQTSHWGGFLHLAMEARIPRPSYVDTTYVVSMS
jgi:hypothetical protein